MFKRSKLLRYVTGLLLFAAPGAAVQAQTYVGAAFGAGGADVPFGSYASGFRGALRLSLGYEFNPAFAVEAITLDLGTPKDKPAGSNLGSTIGGIGVAAVGTLHADRWRFAGSVGVIAIDGKADNASTEHSAQGIVRLGAGYDATPSFTFGLESGVTRVKFGAPVNDAANVHWTALTVVYRFP